MNLDELGKIVRAIGDFEEIKKLHQKYLNKLGRKIARSEGHLAHSLITFHRLRGKYLVDRRKHAMGSYLGWCGQVDMEKETYQKYPPFLAISNTRLSCFLTPVFKYIVIRIGRILIPALSLASQPPWGEHEMA